MRPNYYTLILDTLEGTSHEFTRAQFSKERLDWAGPGVLLDLFGSTSGDSRKEFIAAIGKILGEHRAKADTLAQLVDIASSLDIAEVQADVESLQKDPISRQEPLHGSVHNYLAYRRLRPGRNGA